MLVYKQGSKLRDKWSRICWSEDGGRGLRGEPAELRCNHMPNILKVFNNLNFTRDSESYQRVLATSGYEFDPHADI